MIKISYHEVTMIKVIISRSEIITVFIMLIHYGKCQNIVSRYFYINKVVMPFSFFIPPSPIQYGDPAWGKRERKTTQVIPEPTQPKDRTQLQRNNRITNQNGNPAWEK